MTGGERYRVVVLVDVKQRDLPGYSLLKEILEARYSCDVLLTPALHCRPAILSFRPHLVVLMQIFGPEWIKLSHYLHRLGILVVSLPTEGVPVLLDEDFLDYMAGRYTDKPHLDLQFCWDEEIYRRGIQHKTFSPSTAHVLGVPRFDYYHPDMAPLRMHRDEFFNRYQLLPSRPVITWTSNFGGVDLTLEQHMEGAKQWKFQSVSLFQDIPRYINNERTSRQLIADNLVRWARSHPGNNILVRPHPNEKKEFYLALAKEIEMEGCRAVVPTEVVIWDVLAGTDVLLQRCCTTGVEGWIMDLPVLELRFNDDEIITNAERDGGLDLVKSYEQMEERIAYYLDGGEIPEEQCHARQEFLERWFHKVDGRRTEACAERLWQLLTQSSQEPAISPFMQHLGWWAIRYRKLQYRFGFRKTKRGADTYITERDVRAWSRKIHSSGVLRTLQAKKNRDVVGVAN